MSGPRFTPGPWAIYLDDGKAVNIGHKRDGHIIGLGMAEGDDIDQARANAALIAAAPELYAALEDLEKWCALSTKGELAELSLPRANARIALAKARGEK